MDQVCHLANEGKQLWTREKARDLRAALTPIIDGLAVGDCLVIDAKGVEVFDYSFANELFGKLALAFAGEHAGRFVIVENLTAYTYENLAKALEGMQLAMIERRGGKLELIGKVHPTDHETFNAIVRAKGGATAAELAEKLKINVNAMNERLSKLIGLGLARREKGTSGVGREHFEYHVAS